MEGLRKNSFRKIVRSQPIDAFEKDQSHIQVFQLLQLNYSIPGICISCHGTD
jgi:hypothetical protein